MTNNCSSCQYFDKGICNNSKFNNPLTGVSSETILKISPSFGCKYFSSRKDSEDFTWLLTDRSMYDLALDIGVSQSTIYKFFNHQPLSESMIKKIKNFAYKRVNPE